MCSVLQCCSVSNCEQWMNFTRANLAAAERETRASSELRQLIGHVLQDTSEDLRTQCAKVDEAFNQRCQELTEAKVQLEIHLSQVSAEAHTHPCLPTCPNRVQVN